MKKIFMLLNILMISTTAFAMSCPDPKTFTYTDCGANESCKYHVAVPPGSEGWFPSFHADRVDTKNLQFREANWGKPHDSYRMICKYQDPEHSSWFYGLTVLSEKTDYSRWDFENHPNWYHIGGGAYECKEKNVAQCAFGKK